MREILFRGKTITGEWLYGSLITYGERSFIYPVNGSQEDFHFYGYEVIPETVGQFTGLTDKNGKKIFEGDLLQNDKEIIFEVQWYGALYGFSGYVKKWDSSYSTADFVNYIIVGSIHDNPEF